MLEKRRRLAVPIGIRKPGKTARGEYFLVKRMPANGESRFGVVVGKGVARKATERNRLRRAAYEVIRKKLESSHEADILITVLPRAVGLAPKEFNKILEQALMRQP